MQDMRIVELLLLTSLCLLLPAFTANQIIEGGAAAFLPNQLQGFGVPDYYDICELACPTNGSSLSDVQLKHWCPRSCPDRADNGTAASPIDDASSPSANHRASAESSSEKQSSNVDKKENSSEKSESGSKASNKDQPSDISCKNHKGEDVDWFIAIKKANSNQFIYVTDQQDGTWTHGADITSAESPVQKTLDQKNKEKSKLCTYNNDPPIDKVDESDAHMKGVILYGTEENSNGFWMTHSVPQFPNFNSEQPLWPQGDKKGQSFLCATYKSNWLRSELLTELKYNLCAKFYGPTCELKAWKKEWFKTSKGTSMWAKLKTTGNSCIYKNITISHSEILADSSVIDVQGMLSNVRVQSNRLGTSPPLPSDSSVKNVAFTKFTDEFGYMSFAQDNSKWSIGELIMPEHKKHEYYVCMGDLDRVEAHLNRKGCLVCLQSKSVWDLFNAAIIARLNAPGDYQHNNPSIPIGEGNFPCKTRADTSVDWFVLVKRDGSKNYRYLSSNDKEWTPSTDIENDGPLNVTLVQAFADKRVREHTEIYAYNDESPLKNYSEAGAHAKGVVMIGRESGFWLIHSMPKFPNFHSINSSWNVNFSNTNGQIFFCLTFKPSEADNILKQIRSMEPKFYYFPQTVTTTTTTGGGLAPQTVSDRFKIDKSELPEFQSIRLSSFSGVEFLHISKGPTHEEDIYTIVRNLLDRNLYVRWWKAGGGRNLDNSQTIMQIRSTVGFGATHVMKKDHSKWCVTQDKSMPYFCVGDLNRKESQKKRGGGVLCFMNPSVWEEFKKAIADPIVREM